MSEDSKISKAQQKAVNKYVKNNYDRINVTFPKGQKEVLKQRAAQNGESVNAFIVHSVVKALQQDAGTPPDAPAAAPSADLLPPDTLETAGNSAKATGETVPQFIMRAVEEQAKRDDATRRMGLNPITGAKQDHGSR